MLYRVIYKRRSDRERDKWTEFRECLRVNEITDLLKWLEKNRDSHKLVSVEPF